MSPSIPPLPPGFVPVDFDPYEELPSDEDTDIRPIVQDTAEPDFSWSPGVVPTETDINNAVAVRQPPTAPAGQSLPPLPAGFRLAEAGAAELPPLPAGFKLVRSVDTTGLPPLPDGFRLMSPPDMSGFRSEGSKTLAGQFAIDQGENLPQLSPQMADALGAQQWRDPLDNTEVRRAQPLHPAPKPIPVPAQNDWADAGKAFMGGVADSATSMAQGLYTQAAAVTSDNSFVLSYPDTQRLRGLQARRDQLTNQRPGITPGQGAITGDLQNMDLPAVESEIAALEEKAAKAYKDSALDFISAGYQDNADALGRERDRFAKFYNVDKDFQMSFLGKLVGAAGQMVPQTAAALLPGVGLSALESQAFQQSMDDARETAKRTGVPFNPEQAYAYAATNAFQQMLLEKAGVDAALGKWMKEGGELALRQTLQKLAVGGIGEGTTEAMQGAASDVLASHTGIEQRNPLDPQQRLEEFGIGAILGTGLSTVHTVGERLLGEGQEEAPASPAGEETASQTTANPPDTSVETQPLAQENWANTRQPVTGPETGIPATEPTAPAPTVKDSLTVQTGEAAPVGDEDTELARLTQQEADEMQGDQEPGELEQLENEFAPDPNQQTENTPLPEGALPDMVQANGRRFLRKLLRSAPLRSEMDEETRRVFQTRFNTWLDEARASAANLGSEISTLPEADQRLLFASHDRDGRVTIHIHPRAFESLLGVAKGHGDAFERLTKDVFTEELLHGADLLSSRDSWLSLPEKSRGSFESHVQQERTARFHDIRMAREKATGAARATIDGAILDAYRLYFEDADGGRVARTADKALEILESAPSREVNHVAFVAEFTRMLAQAERSGQASETGFAGLIDKLRAWVEKAIARLKDALGRAKSGELGQMMQQRLDEISRRMNGKETAKVPGSTPGNNTFSRFSPRATDVAEAVESLRKTPAPRMQIYERAKAKLAEVSERVHQKTEQLRNVGTNTQAIDNTAEGRLRRVEQEKNAALDRLEAQEKAEIEEMGQKNTAEFMDRIDLAKTPEARTALLRDARKVAAAKRAGIEKTYAARRAAIEQRANERARGIAKERNIRTDAKDNAALTRAEMLGSLAKLEAVLSVLPPAVRGRIGGVAKMASLKTDAAREKYLADRVGKVADALETHMKAEYLDRIEKLLDRAKPKRGENRVLRSKIGPGAQADVDYITSVSEMDGEALAEKMHGLTAIIENTETSPKARAEAVNKWILADRFGDLANRSAEELADASRILADTIRGGRERWKIQEEARIEGNRDQVEQAQKEAQRPYGAMANDLRTSKEEKDNGFLRGIRDFLEGSLAWYQDLQEVFGVNSETAKRFERIVRFATGKYEDGTIAARHRFKRDMLALLGVKTELGLHGKLAKLSKMRDTNIRFLEGRKVQAQRIPIDRVLDALSGKADTYGFSREELFDLQGILDDLDPDSRKTKIVYDRVINQGTPTDQRMSELHAIDYLLMAGQQDVRERMARQGIDETAITQMEKFLSDDGRKVLGWLKERYSSDEEYDRKNAVYRNLFGMDMPRVQNYSPTSYETSNANTGAVGPDGSPMVQGGSMPSFIKGRVGHDKMVSSVNALEKYFRHTMQSEYWMAFAEANRDIRSVIGNDDVLRAVKAAYGEHMAKKLGQWMKAFEQNGLRADDVYGKLSSFMQGVMGANAVIALGGKIGVLMKQTSAALGSLIEIPAHQAAYSMGRMLSGRLAQSLPETWKSPTIQRRVESGFSPAVRAVMNQGGINPGALLILAEKGMAPISLVDAAFTTFSAAVAYDYHYRRARGSGMTESEASAFAADRMDEVVHRTAQPASVADRSIVEASNNPFMKLLMMFRSEPRQKAAISYQAFKQILQGEGGLKGMGMNAQKIAVAWVLMSVVTQTMANLYRDWFTDDEDEEIWTWQNYARAAALGPINGFFLAGDFISDIANWLTGGRVFPQSRTPLDEAGKAIRQKKNNPANWKDADDVVDGMRAFTATAGRLSRSGALAAPSIVLNAAHDAMGLYGNMREAMTGPREDVQILRVGRRFAAFKGAEPRGMGDDRKRLYQALTTGDRKTLNAYVTEKFKKAGKAGRQGAGRHIVLQSIRETIDGLSPYRMAAGSREKVGEFRRWAQTNLTKEEQAAIERMESTYRKTKAGLSVY